MHVPQILSQGIWMLLFQKKSSKAKIHQYMKTHILLCIGMSHATGKLLKWTWRIGKGGCGPCAPYWKYAIIGQFMVYQIYWHSWTGIHLIAVLWWVAGKLILCRSGLQPGRAMEQTTLFSCTISREHPPLSDLYVVQLVHIQILRPLRDPDHFLMMIPGMSKKIKALIICIFVCLPNCSSNAEALSVVYFSFFFELTLKNPKLAVL